MPSRDSSVGRASAWSHTVSGSMIAPSFESHQCLAGMWKRWLSCHAGCQEVCRCHTRGESQGMCNVTRSPLLNSNKAEPTLALKPRGDVTRSPKQGYQWPHKKDSCPPKFIKKTKKLPLLFISTKFILFQTRAVFQKLKNNCVVKLDRWNKHLSSSFCHSDGVFQKPSENCLWLIWRNACKRHVNYLSFTFGTFFA